MPNNCSRNDCSCKESIGDETTCSKSTSNLSASSILSSDGVWDSDSDLEPGYTGTTNVSKDIEALKRVHENRGYLDGITKGGEEGLQNGFDEGYPIGAQLAGIVGELIADVVLRNSLGQINEETKNNALSELKIEKILNSKYFDPNLNITDPRNHPVIRKWSDYFDKLGSPVMF